jgi:hypothetical protein
VTRGTHGQKVLGNLRSICPELEVNGAQARFRIQGHAFQAQVQDSTYSDGGDLSDLTIRGARGEILAKAPTVLAYGDVILALALGNPEFVEIEDDTLLLNR